jgi:hypothetical protein
MVLITFRMFRHVGPPCYIWPPYVSSSHSSYVNIFFGFPVPCIRRTWRFICELDCSACNTILTYAALSRCYNYRCENLTTVSILTFVFRFVPTVTFLFIEIFKLFSSCIIEFTCFSFRTFWPRYSHLAVASKTVIGMKSFIKACSQSLVSFPIWILNSIW